MRTATHNSAPTVPVQAQATVASESQVSLTWAASSDASGVSSYRVYRNSQLVGTVATTAFNDSGLAGNLEYCYTVAAVDSLGNISSASAPACATTPAALDLAAPTIPAGVLAVAPNCGQVNVSWTAASDAGSGLRSYWVFKNGTVWRQVFAPNTTISDFSVAPSSAYSYAVAAVDMLGNQSLNSTVATVTTPDCSQASGPTTPTALTVSASDCRTANLSWGGSTAGNVGIRGYNVYKNNSLLRQVTATSATDNTLAANSAYTYAVAAVDNAGNESPRTAAVLVSTPACTDTTPPTAPGTLTVTVNDCGTASLTWGASTDAGGSGLRGYNVYRSGIYIQQVLPPATSAIDNTLSPNSTYDYLVSAVDYAGNESAPSGPGRASTPSCPDAVPPTAPAAVTAAAQNCSTISIAWMASTDSGGSGLQGYRLYRNGSFLKLVLTPATSATDSGLAESAGYSYTVRAVDNAGNVSPLSAAANGVTPACADTTAPSVPGGVVATAASCGRVDVSWTASSDLGSGVRGYRVYRNNQLLQEVLAPALTWSDSSVASATTYSYSVSAFDNAGNYSAASTGATTATPGCAQLAAGQFVSVTTLGDTDSNYGYAIAVDPSGNIFVGGTSAGTPYLAKLSPTKTLLWSRHFPNMGNIQSIALDPNGNVVFTGYFYGTADFGGGPLTSAGGYDVIVGKYSGAGQYIWVNRYGSPYALDFAGEEAGSTIAVDPNGDIAVGGTFYNVIDFGGGPRATGGNKNGFVLKLTSNGTYLWDKNIGVSGNNSATFFAATAVAFDLAGNLYVGGYGTSGLDLGGGVINPEGAASFVAKYTTTGNHLWSRRSGGRPGAIGVDRSGDVAVTGTLGRSGNFDGLLFASQGEEDVFLAKYSGSNGTQQWAKAFGSWNTDWGYSVATDSGNNIVIAGRAGGPINFGGGTVATARDGMNIYVAKFTPAGSHLWSKALGNGREEARGVAVDSLGHSFITGRFTFTQDFGGGPFSNAGNNGNSDIYVLELAP